MILGRRPAGTEVPRRRGSMLGWFRALMPKEERFFDLFVQHSKMVVAGAEALRAMLDGGSGMPEHFKEVMDREQDADNITREVLMAVRRTFITPFDRGDITDLITSMDNSIDQMQKTAKGINLFEVRTFTPHMKEVADTIVNCARLVEEAMPLLRSISSNAARLSEISERVSHLEGHADEMHDIGLKELYLQQTGSNSVAFFVGYEIYDHLEKVVDRFDDVANEIHGIVIEHV
jgi:predicted phosphate transport protein (TIGR00153 family)